MESRVELPVVFWFLGAGSRPLSSLPRVLDRELPSERLPRDDRDDMLGCGQYEVDKVGDRMSPGKHSIGAKFVGGFSEWTSLSRLGIASDTYAPAHMHVLQKC